MEQELDNLRKKNKELEREGKAGKEREASLQHKLAEATSRLQVIEEAEERLSVQMGEFEADSLEQARAYEVRVQQLTEQLNLAHRIMAAYGIKLGVIDKDDD